ncbi:hypothetical protein BOX15_Mlig027076g1, partial [Macrostomum lignano]
DNQKIAMATETKPNAKYQPVDWFTNAYAISSNAERQREASDQVRQEARFLRNETDNKTKWDQKDNNTRLADRVDVIRKWKEILEQTLGDLDAEIAKLSESKEQTEEALERKNLPTDTVNECLTVRDGRRSIDNVEDEIEHQLRKEQEVIAKAKRNLQQKVDEQFEQLCVLQEARQQILADLQNKNIALGIDIDQYNLNEQSPNISYKPNPTRVPKGSTTPQQWEDFSRYNVDRAKAEIASSGRLREAAHRTIHDTDNDLESQRQASDYALRKRLHEEEQAKDELEWQKQQTEDEIAELERDIRALEEAIKAKIPPAKLAETRLENRTTRPGVELCRDAVQYGLTDEVQQIKASKDALYDKLKQARHNLDGLQKQLDRINADLAEKTNSIMLDRRTADVRNRLATKPITQTDGNMLKTGITRERSKVLA